MKRLSVRAFENLHDECRTRVYCGILGYVRNQTEAEEVTAAAYATAFEKRESFRREASFFTWVYRIAINKVHSDRRGNKTISLDAIEESAPDILVQANGLDSVLDRANCCGRLRIALKCVPTKYRQALIDHFVRGYSTRQIARRRRIPQGTVLRRIFNGKKLLREAWTS